MAFSTPPNDKVFKSAPILNPGNVNIATAKAIAKLTNPLADAVKEAHNPDSKSLEMPPKSGICSACIAAEMIELLYWMAILRGVPLADITGADADISSVIEEVSLAYSSALEDNLSAGRIQ